MVDATNPIRSHYGRPAVIERIDEFLRRSGVDPSHPDYTDLHPFDQLHGRGVQATREHAERAGLFAGIGADVHVLDLGCGIGGSARYLAVNCHCRVTGIDLTPEYIEIARELTARCRLAERIDYRQGDALHLPFDAASFDHVWCHNVTMNIAAKRALAAEIARVLKPGGRLSCVEVQQGPGGEPIFPLPWAAEPSASFLVTPEAMRAALEAGGLRVLEDTDITALNLAFQKDARARAERGEKPVQMNQVVMGEDFAIRGRNFGKCLGEQRTVEHFILAEKP